ncbi:MAG: hypothetical protein JWO58_880 [Chitinophagaceae bacterium]|nr:hypothetical protein [Chitinophagaceae bacterium]
MKTLYAFALLFLMSLGVQAQTMTITVTNFSVPLPDGGTFAIGAIPYGTSQAVSFSIHNDAGASTDLILTKVGSNYVTLGGNAAPEVTLDESTTSGDIPAGLNTHFTVTNSGAEAPGDYTLTLSIVNNDGSHNPYTGTVTYTVSPPTSILSAKEVGLSLSPVPSTDGRITINSTGNTIVNKVIVYGPNGMSEPFEGVMNFHTRQKGVLVVQIYTDKGFVEEKILVQ